MKTLVGTALATLLVLSATQDASAWTRRGSFTGARGTYNSSAVGACAHGACTRSETIVGPKGKTVTENGVLTRTAPGQYSYTGQATGPKGGVYNTTGEVNKTAPGQYNYNSTTTGPFGGSVSREGSITVVRPPQTQ